MEPVEIELKQQSGRVVAEPIHSPKPENEPNMHKVLPVAGGRTFLTEGGIETYMQYKKGREFRHFCLFDLMNDDRAMIDLRQYHVDLIEVALKHKVGAVLDGVHYRTSRDWGDLLGYSRQSLANIVIRGIEFYNGSSPGI